MEEVFLSEKATELLNEAAQKYIFTLDGQDITSREVATGLSLFVSSYITSSSLEQDQKQELAEIMCKKILTEVMQGGR